MPGFMHLFASSIYGVCGLSLAVGAVVFVRNAIRRGDLDYEARFPRWVRLSFYLLVLVIPLAGVIGQDMSLNASVWTNFLLGIVALAIPAVGLLSSLWLVAFRRTRERVKFGKALLFVSLIPIVLWIGIAVDPATRAIH
jgi:cytochrome bd-type quinol oxidase subunit 2